MVITFPKQNKKLLAEQKEKVDAEFIESVGAQDCDDDFKEILAFAREIGVKPEQITSYEPGENESLVNDLSSEERHKLIKNINSL